MKERDLHLDWLKFILMFFVVFAHTLIPLAFEPKYVYLFIFFFHMPAFIFISGYFSKTTSWSKYMKQSIYLFESYLVVQLLFMLIIYRTFDWGLWLINPYWISWYLLGMIFWKGLLVLLKPLRHSQVIFILLALVIAVLTGFLPHLFYKKTIAKIFILTPFFAIGYALTKERMQRLLSFRWKYLLAILFIALAIYLVVGQYWLSDRFIENSRSFANINLPICLSIMYRLAFMLVSLGLIYALLVISKIYVPQSLARLGRGTYEIFLFHMPILMLTILLIKTPNNYLSFVIYFSISYLLSLLISQFKYKHFLTNPITSIIAAIREKL